MRVSASFDGLDDVMRAIGNDVFEVIDGEVEAGTEALKADLRAETEAVLGRRVANAWRSRFYSNKGDAHGPAGLVWSRAARIINFFSADRIITPIGGAFAIPVNPVVKRGGRPMTPVEVEARFNQELIAKPLPSGNLGLFLRLISGRSGRGFRAASRGRLAQGRKAVLTLMFVLIRTLRGHKLIDLEALGQRRAERVAANIERQLGN